jgi:hypothetical protein
MRARLTSAGVDTFPVSSREAREHNEGAHGGNRVSPVLEWGREDSNLRLIKLLEESGEAHYVSCSKRLGVFLRSLTRETAIPAQQGDLSTCVPATPR